MSYGVRNGYSDSSSIGTGGDLLNALYYYLGPPNQDAPLNLDLNGKNPVTTQFLPMAYLGSNLTLASIFEQKLINKNDWYVSKLLPLKKTEEINIAWTTFKYDASYFEVLPFGGNPNFVQNSTSGGSDKLLQRGMGFQIAHGFWKTEQGHQSYRMNIETIEASQTITIYHLIIMAVLQAKNVYRNSDLKFKNAATSVKEGLKRTRARWAMCNKSMAETRKFIANQQEYMANNGVTPNILALPPKTLILFSHDHESEYNFDQAGPLSQKVRTEGQKAYATIRGIPVYETTVFNEEVFGENHNPLRRLREYGSYFFITNFHGGSHLESYKNEERFAARILDANKDQDVRVSGKNMFKYCNRFDTNGNLSADHSQLIRDGNLNDLKRRFGVLDHENYVDMFIGYDPSLPENHYVMRYMGEMWQHDVGKDKIRNFAITAANKLSGLSAEEIQSVTDAKNFMDALGNLDLFNPQHRAYLRAVVYSGTVAGGENRPIATQADGMFKNNGLGSINPPIFIQHADGPYIMYVKVNGQNRPVALAIRDGYPDVLLEENTVVDNNGDLVGPPANTAFVKFEKPPLPYGFGHMSGLRTLAHMHRNGDRGYDKEVLREASIHYNTIVKFHSVWKTIFPEHDLGSVDACPHWFLTGDDTLDEATAFAHNLYDHARYPFFGIAIRPDNQAQYDATNPSEATNTLRARVALGTANCLGGIIQTYITNVINANGVPQVNQYNSARLQTRLNHFATRTTSQRVKSSLLEGNLLSKLELGYRNNHMIDQTGRNVQLNALLFKAIGGDDQTWNATTDAIAIRNLTKVLDVLLSGQSREEPIDWKSLMSKRPEVDPPIVLQGNRPFSGTPPRNPEEVVAVADHGTFYNTRLCINALCFREYADQMLHVTDAQIAQNHLKNLVVRPMNVLNPTQPLGTQESHQIPQDIQRLKVPILEMKFAAYPLGANTVSSLTTSPVFESHVRNRNTSKRKNVDFAASGARKTRRKTLVGGVLVNNGANPYPDQDYGHYDAENSVYSGIPLSESIYRQHTDQEWAARVDPDPDGAVPAHIAFSDVMRVFDFTADHNNILGIADTVRRYRSNLIRRFHEWAYDNNRIHKIFAQSWITTKITRQAFETFWDQDCLPLVSFELHRMRQRYYMGSGILAEGGDKLGNAYHGHHDFQVGDDVITKTHTGNYEFMFSATIQNPKYVCVLEDIVSMGYVSGEDVSWIRNRDDFVRLKDDVDNAAGSILVKMVPYSEELPDIVQDVAGRWNESAYMQTSMESSSVDNRVHGASTYYYGHMYGLERLNHNRARRDYLFHDDTKIINTTVWRGHHKLYNPITQQWDQIITDQGPFGQNVYSGVIRDRDGGSIKDLRLEDKASIFG